MKRNRLHLFLLIGYEVLSVVALVSLFFIEKYNGKLYWLDVKHIYGNINAEITYVFFTLVLPIALYFTYFKAHNSRSHIAVLITLLALNVVSYRHMLVHSCDRSFLGFVSLAVCLYASYFIYSYYYISKNFKHLENEIQNNKTTLAETSSSIMLGQMKPHFMYNTLNTIKYLISEDPDRAEYAIDKFSSYLRTNMNAIEKTNLIPFSEELSHIQNYVDVEKLRFEDRINVIYDIKENNFFLPPLSVQPLVENAIKHGITKKVSGGTVTITTKKSAGIYTIEVKDDGVGFDPSKLDEESVSIAIANIKKRIATIRGATFKIVSKIGEGTTCTITIPSTTKLSQ